MSQDHRRIVGLDDAPVGARRAGDTALAQHRSERADRDRRSYSYRDYGHLIPELLSVVTAYGRSRRHPASPGGDPDDALVRRWGISPGGRHAHIGGPARAELRERNATEGGGRDAHSAQDEAGGRRPEGQLRTGLDKMQLRSTDWRHAVSTV